MSRCSAVLIALDEEHRIGDAVRSVRPYVDEVLVLDGGSVDRTCERAQQAGARVLEHPFDGFVSQKQRATLLARNDLVFALDADERVDRELARSLQEALDHAGSSGLAAWRVRRRNYLDGRPLRASGWYPDWRIRLFDRRRVSWSGEEPHDRLQTSGPVGVLAGHLIHDPSRTSAELRRSTRLHAERRAHSLARSSRLIGPLSAPLRALGHLLRKLLLNAALRDGRRGLTVALVGAGGVYQKYRRALQLRTGQ
tara:strand:+ start:626 stop:1384 length:759 start_codon:yes stop_codon:yes gene_type:complete